MYVGKITKYSSKSGDSPKKTSLHQQFYCRIGKF